MSLIVCVSQKNIVLAGAVKRGDEGASAAKIQQNDQLQQSDLSEEGPEEGQKSKEPEASEAADKAPDPENPLESLHENALEDKKGFLEIERVKLAASEMTSHIQQRSQALIREIKLRGALDELGAKAEERRKKRAIILARDAKLAKLRRQYSLYPKNIISVDFGAQYIFAEKGSYNDKIYLDRVGSIATAKQLRGETTFFSLSGYVGYTRMLSRKSFVNLSLGTRGANDRFLTDPRGIKSDFASTTLSIMGGGEILRRGGFFIRASAGALISFVYIDPVSDRNIRAGAELQAKGEDYATGQPVKPDDYLLRIGRTYTFGGGVALGLDFGYNFGKINTITFSMRGSIGPELLYYAHEASFGFSSYGSAEFVHQIAISQLIDIYYKTGFGVMYIKSTSEKFFLTYFMDLFVSANVGINFKF